MKKLLLVSILAACGGSEKKPAPAPVVSNTAPVPVPTPPPPPPPVQPVQPVAVGQLPPGTPAECIAYLEVMSSIMTCDKLPQEARDALKQGADAMRDGMLTADMPPESLAAMKDGCKAGLDAMQQARGRSDAEVARGDRWLDAARAAARSCARRSRCR